MSNLIDRNEVIEIIESVCSADDSYWQPGTLEKIRNLPTHPTPSNTLGALDCVDRAEAIKAVKFYETFYGPYPRVIEALEDLPSAQPEIIRCRNCKFASGDSRICMQFGHSPIGELDFCAWAERRTDG